MIAFLIATCVYSVSMSITPGPTNIIMMSTGVNHGFRSTISFATGAAVGFSALIIMVALGLGRVFTENEKVTEIMTYVGAGMICYMGYKIAFSGGDMEVAKSEQPNFLHGTILQWINPKSWIACLAGVSAFNLSVSGERLALYVIVYTSVGYLCVLTGGYAGSKISGFLQKEKNLRIFNYVMGGSLLLVAVYLAMMER